MILFNVPIVTGSEFYNIAKLLTKMKFCGDAEFTHKCNRWIEANLHAPKALLTTSGTHALEMAAILADIGPGDEVVMPSFTFVSTANAFVLRGAKIVFVDIRPDTMNLDEKLIENAVSKKTKAIVPVHYAGISCEMDQIGRIARQHGLMVIEDAAQAMMSSYKGRSLGTLGDFGTFSFHETKNYQCGEGGAILINDEKYFRRAEIIREKGTNRSEFLRGEIDKYTWVDIGSSYLPSDLSAAFLYAQLEMAESIKAKRVGLWNRYYENLSALGQAGLLELPVVPEHCDHNGHMFYLKLKSPAKRQKLIGFLKENEIQAVFHYLPLHTTDFGKKHSRFVGEDRHTTDISRRLLRLPLYWELTLKQVDYICDKIQEFMKPAGS